MNIKEQITRFTNLEKNDSLSCFWCEINEEDILSYCQRNNLSSYYHEKFKNVSQVCKIKEL